MAKKKLARFESLSTPDLTQPLADYLVELAFLRRNKGRRLPPRFWRKHKYKFSFIKQMKAINKYIREYGEAIVLCAAMNNHIDNWNAHKRITYILQYYQECVNNRRSPKDLSEVQPDSVGGPTRDLRKSIPRRKQNGLFNKIKEFENES